MSPSAPSERFPDDDSKPPILDPVNRRPTTPAAPATLSNSGLRLRLMALLAVYDLLPYSISHPPNDEEPLDLGSAVDARALHRCLQTMAQQGKLTVEDAKALSTVCNADTN